jgi:hypothetical protein
MRIVYTLNHINFNQTSIIKIDLNMYFLQNINKTSLTLVIGFIALQIRGYIQKFPDWPPGERTANGTALRH